MTAVSTDEALAAVDVLARYVAGRDDELADAVVEVRRRLAIESRQAAAREVLDLIQTARQEAETSVRSLIEAATGRPVDERVALWQQAFDAGSVWRRVQRWQGRRCERRRKDGKRCGGSAIAVLPHATCSVHATPLERQCADWVESVRADRSDFELTEDDIWGERPPLPPPVGAALQDRVAYLMETEEAPIRRLRLAPDPQPHPYQPGDEVNHARWGEGVVVSCAGQGAKAEILVNFKRVGEKHLLVAWAPIWRAASGH